MLPRNPSPTSGRAGQVRTLLGLVAAGLVLGGAASVLLRTAGEWLQPSAALAAKSGAAAKSTAEATAGGAAGSGAESTVPAPAVRTVPSGARPRAAATAPSGPAPSAPRGKPGAPGGAAVSSAAHLDEHVTYHYNALGRRDPFQSLIGGEYVGVDVGGGAPPDVGGVKVVGIVWGDADQFALVEDARGDSHILRRGDKVMNGYVESLTRDAMLVNLTLDGQSQTVRVPLTRKGDKSNANR